MDEMQASTVSIENEVLQDQKSVCNICQNSFANLSKVKEHQKFVHNTCNEYECDLCEKIFHRSDVLNNHIKFIHKNDSSEEQCLECDLKLKNKFYLERHVATVHKGIPRNKNYNCEQCGKSFACAVYLETHENYYHNGKRNFKCEKCDETFGSKRGLTWHISQSHEKHNHSCDLCSKSFGNVGALTKHVKTSHLGEQTTLIYECDICEKTFSRLSNIKDHYSYIHDRRKIHFCKYCEESFSRVGTLRLHIKQKHKNGAKGKEFCHMCDANFVKLTDHLKAFHMREKEVDCHICNKTLANVSNLNLHLTNVHSSTSGKKVCDICFKELKSSESLTLHMQRIHQEKA